jgi:hypothetical protein
VWNFLLNRAWSFVSCFLQFLTDPFCCKNPNPTSLLNFESVNMFVLMVLISFEHMILHMYHLVLLFDCDSVIILFTSMNRSVVNLGKL